VDSLMGAPEEDCFAEELSGADGSNGRSKAASVWVGGGGSLRGAPCEGNSQAVNRAIIRTKRLAVPDARWTDFQPDVSIDTPVNRTIQHDIGRWDWFLDENAGYAGSCA